MIEKMGKFSICLQPTEKNLKKMVSGRQVWFGGSFFYEYRIVTLKYKALLKMNKEKYLDDLKVIRSVMSRSSRFLSLSGLSGIVAGILALAGAYLAYLVVYSQQDSLSYRVAILNNANILKLTAIAIFTFTLSLSLGIYLSWKKAKKYQENLWSPTTRMLIINFSIPLLTGGLLCIILLFKGLIGLIAPLTLIFYGLALVNASKFTLSQVKSLGIAEIVLGLIAMQYVGFGLLFWAFGFGVLHIAYGIFIQKIQGERNS